MATICDLLDELHKAGSPIRAQWMADKSVEGRMHVAKDFGVAGDDLKMCKKALETKNGKAVEDHCGPPHGAWVR